MNGKLEQIWIKPDHGATMEAVGDGVLDQGRGLQRDVNYQAPRPVTIIESARWSKAQQELGAQVDPSARRANLLVSGVDLIESKGKQLRIGSTLLHIKGETRPCGLMDEMHPGLRQALVADWGGGAYADVLEGGAIQLGDAVSWVD